MTSKSGDVLFAAAPPATHGRVVPHGDVFLITGKL